MAWAIDLDDGSLIEELFSNLGKPKPLVLDPPGPNLVCFGLIPDNNSTSDKN